MATLRSIFFRRIVAAALFCGSLISLGAAFAPWGPSFLRAPDPMPVGPSLESGFVPDTAEVRLSSGRGAVFGRLEELILTHRAISVSA